MGELARTLYDDFPAFAKLCLKIEDKKGKLVPFELNDAQKIIWREIKRQMDAKLPVRLLILKGRQQGCSTLAQALAMWLSCTREGMKSMVVAHKLKPAAQELFGKAELMYSNLPPEVKGMVPLAPGRATGRRLKFDDPFRSLLVVESAEESDAVGRSGTFAFGHLTEIPFWPKADETIAAFMACVPSDPETFVIIESTARGMGDWFHRAWTQAENDVANGERPEFYPVFIPWFKQREYRRKRDKMDAPLTAQERGRMAMYGLEDEQILWYRDKLKVNGELTPQEFPDCAKDAFLTSGMPYFRSKPVELLAKHAEQTPPLRKGGWDVRKEAGRTIARFEEHAGGALWVWESPKPDRTYVVSVDPATGRAKDTSAYHVLDVTNPSRIEQVASYQGDMTPDDLAVHSILTARYYNNALWSPERNGAGELTVSKGVNDIGYSNVYRHKQDAVVNGKRSVIQGWVTSPKTRGLALESLAELIHNDLIVINCIRTVRELQTFVFVGDDGKKAAAAPGSTDDLVMALAIGAASRHQSGGEISFEVWE